MKFFASCAKGLEYLLVDELLALGCRKATAALAGAHVEGDLQHAQRAVLWSRLASRILWPLSEFECADENALYAGAAAVRWRDHLRVDQTLAVDAHVSGSGVTHSRYAAQRVKDAVVDSLRTSHGERPSVDVQAPDLRLSLVLRKDWATLSVDLGGGPLHRRGWRQAQGEAPLKESLAAAMLLRGQWPRVYAEGGTLLDPMCGSGTLLIEGAAMAADVAPGLLRHGEAVPSRWLGFDAATWKRLCAEAEQRRRAGRATLRRVFHGSDRDPKAIANAALNATAAGFGDVIQLVQREVSQLPAMPATPPGLVVCNPPYDERMAADAEAYRALGDALKRAVPDWRASVLCGSTDLAYASGLRATKKYQLFNGAIECALLACNPILRVRPERTTAPA